MDSHCGPLCFSESGPTDSHCGLKLYRYYEYMYSCTVLDLESYCMVRAVLVRVLHDARSTVLCRTVQL